MHDAEPVSTCTSLPLVVELRGGKNLGWQRELGSHQANVHNLGLSLSKGPDLHDSSSGCKRHSYSGLTIQGHQVGSILILGVGRLRL